MLNEEKIRLMTGIAMFEKKMMKESIPANRYFKSDYVGSHLIRSFIAYSLTVCLCLMLWVLYRFDDLINAMAVDDLLFEVKGVDIRRFGSQGQQRTAALSLKLAEIELVKRAIKDTPVLLLDDVLSELDSSRQQYLLDSIHDIQTLITCTGIDDFIENKFQLNKVFHVADGVVCEG